MNIQLKTKITQLLKTKTWNEVVKTLEAEGVKTPRGKTYTKGNLMNSYYTAGKKTKTPKTRKVMKTESSPSAWESFALYTITNYPSVVTSYIKNSQL